MKQYWGRILQKDIYPSRKESRLPRLTRAFWVIAFCLVSMACTKQMRLSFETSGDLNKDESGIALPVVVRIYQLQNKERLEQADFHSLWKNDREVLEADLLDRREMILHPGEKMRIDLDLKKESGFVAVMVLFRKPEGKSWRQVVSLKGWGRRSFEISVQKRAIRFIEK